MDDSNSIKFLVRPVEYIFICLGYSDDVVEAFRDGFPEKWYRILVQTQAPAEAGQEKTAASETVKPTRGRKRGRPRTRVIPNRESHAIAKQAARNDSAHVVDIPPMPEPGHDVEGDFEVQDVPVDSKRTSNSASDSGAIRVFPSTTPRPRQISQTAQEDAIFDDHSPVKQTNDYNEPASDTPILTHTKTDFQAPAAIEKKARRTPKPRLKELIDSKKTPQTLRDEQPSSSARTRSTRLSGVSVVKFEWGTGRIRVLEVEGRTRRQSQKLTPSRPSADQQDESDESDESPNAHRLANREHLVVEDDDDDEREDLNDTSRKTLSSRNEPFDDEHLEDRSSEEEGKISRVYAPHLSTATLRSSTMSDETGEQNTYYQKAMNETSSIRTAGPINRKRGRPKQTGPPPSEKNQVRNHRVESTSEAETETDQESRPFAAVSNVKVKNGKIYQMLDGTVWTELEDRVLEKSVFRFSPQDPLYWDKSTFFSLFVSRC
jgi:hypothetical protein